MEDQGPSPDLGPTEALAYDRDAVLRYLDEADDARRRLQTELDVLLDGDHASGSPVADPTTSSAASELCALTGRLDDDRQATWSTIQHIVGDAKALAAEILASAHAQADRVRSDVARQQT